MGPIRFVLGLWVLGWRRGGGLGVLGRGGGVCVCVGVRFAGVCVSPAGNDPPSRSRPGCSVCCKSSWSRLQDLCRLERVRCPALGVTRRNLGDFEVEYLCDYKRVRVSALGGGAHGSPLMSLGPPPPSPFGTPQGRWTPGSLVTPSVVVPSLTSGFPLVPHKVTRAPRPPAVTQRNPPNALPTPLGRTRSTTW